MNTIWLPLIKEKRKTMAESAKLHSKYSAVAVRKVTTNEVKRNGSSKSGNRLKAIRILGPRLQN